MSVGYRLSRWLKAYLGHRSFGGESQLAMELKGEEVIHKHEWAELSESERGKWEAVDEYSGLYRRERERW